MQLVRNTSQLPFPCFCQLGHDFCGHSQCGFHVFCATKETKCSMETDKKNNKFVFALPQEGDFDTRMPALTNDF